ncbi:101 kDa malaria antigen-like [Drosophila teissieri]|uniref:101 kDa malaria antigen-like n=1 Tax=Drosophila teissieri TaxID=7243 RepID=UPI001CB9D935|nr:101 kDa malaria antigen-like [Drosophila teissieri]
MEEKKYAVTVFMDIQQDFDRVWNKGLQSICTLHKFVFEEEGDRNNRKRLREFTGFNYDENAAAYIRKCTYIDEHLNERDLTSICVVLGISHDVENAPEHIYRNLQYGNLLAYDENGQNDESDEESENDEDNKSEEENQIDEGNSAHGIGRDRRNTQDETPRFAISFRDIEESIKQFDGGDETPIEKATKEKAKKSKDKKVEKKKKAEKEREREKERKKAEQEQEKEKQRKSKKEKEKDKKREKEKKKAAKKKSKRRRKSQESSDSSGSEDSDKSSSESSSSNSSSEESDAEPQSKINRQENVQKISFEESIKIVMNSI